MRYWIFAGFILAAAVAPALAKGGHGHGMSGGFPLLRGNPHTSFGYAPPPPKGAGGHSGETPFAIPDYGSPNVHNFPGRLP